MIKIRAKSYSQILGLATRQEGALFAQAEEGGIKEMGTDDPRDRGGEAGRRKRGGVGGQASSDNRVSGVWGQPYETLLNVCARGRQRVGSRVCPAGC